MYTDYVMIDYENIQQVDWKPFRGLKKKVVVYVGHTQSNIRYELVVEIHRHGEHAEYVKISGNGKNTLDYHIALEIGMLCCEHPEARFHIVSNDKGYEALADHLRKKHGVEVIVHRQAPDTPFPAKKPDEPPTNQQPAAPKLAGVPKAIASANSQGIKSSEVQARYVYSKIKKSMPGTLDTLKKHIGTHALSQHLSTKFGLKINGRETDAIIATMQKLGLIRIDQMGKIKATGN